MKEIRDIKLDSSTKIVDLIKMFSDTGGFTAKKLATASEIMEKIFSECELKLLSFPACIISTGTRGIIKDIIKKKLFDIIITTCGTLDHDFARCFKPYYQGHFMADDRELHRRRIHRLGNVFIPFDNYGKIIEDRLQPVLKEIYNSGKKEMSTHEFVWEIGKRIRNEDSIIYWCYRNNIPMIIPGITDGAFGTQLAIFMQDHPDFRIDAFKDEKYLMERMFGEIKAGALMIGGGISKHHVIWWSAFIDGLEYAVQLSTAPEWDGSLSGARTREAITWGKIKEEARHITVEGDATVLLPLLLARFL